MTSKLALAPAVLMLLGGLAACGDDSPKDDASSKEPASEDTTDSGAGDGTSVDEPLAADAVATLGTDWEISIASVNADAAEAVTAYDETATAPEDGIKFVLVGLEVTYTGDDKGEFGLSVETGFHTADGETLTNLENDCNGALLENDILLAGETAAGKSTSGNLCLSIPEDQLDGGVWSFENFITMEDVVYVAFEG